MKVVIVRHGNTFDKGDIIRRVGSRTDLPLSQSGLEQVDALGAELAKKYGHFDKCYVSELQRTQQTADAILKHCHQTPTYEITSMLNEVDYGDDDGKPEDEVVARLGKEVIENWDKHDIVPDGWQINPESIRYNWRQLSSLWRDYQTILIVTSNGIARFIDCLLEPSDTFFKTHSKKLKTAHYGEIQFTENQWLIKYWPS